MAASSDALRLLPESGTVKVSDRPPEPYHWLSKVSDCPKGVLEMLNSRACRSAIMFNDWLSLDQCRDLVRSLARCSFPFQCAHGRPSMVPLVDLGTTHGDQGGTSGAILAETPELPRQDFARAFSDWQKGA